MSQIDSLLDGINTTDHIMLFYDTQENKRKILYNYLADGLRRGKGIVYVLSEETLQDVHAGLAKHGVDVELNLASGNIMTPGYDEIYIHKGSIEAMRILRKWQELSRHFQSRGLGMRVTGETSFFFREGKVREFLRYEYALKKVLPLPMDAICAYNLNVLVETGYTDLIMPLVRAHGKAIFVSKSGTMVLEPENIEDTDIEALLDIRI
jgi:hypothetical protein